MLYICAQLYFDVNVVEVFPDGTIDNKPALGR